MCVGASAAGGWQAFSTAPQADKAAAGSGRTVSWDALPAHAKVSDHRSARERAKIEGQQKYSMCSDEYESCSQ